MKVDPLAVETGMAPRRVDKQRLYRVFDLVLASDIPLPELASHVAPGADLTVTTMAQEPEIDGFEPRYEWRDARGALIVGSARRGAEYQLNFPGLATFDVMRGRIRCFPRPGLAAITLRQLLLNQVLTRYVAYYMKGLVLHASAVTLPGGRTVAMLGESGAGKSTLAAYCRQRGAGLIDDDAILVQSGGGFVGVLGGASTLRLAEDSLRALGHDKGDVYSPRSGKWLLQTVPEAANVCRPLDGFFLLETPGSIEGGQAIHIDAVAGGASVMALVANAFSLDPADPIVMAQTFDRVAAILRLGPRVHRLRYPRKHALLPDVYCELEHYCAD